MSISAHSPVGVGPIAAHAPAPPALPAPAVRVTLPVATPVGAPPRVTATATPVASALNGDAGEIVQAEAAAVLVNALIAYPPIPITPVRPAIPPVAAVLPTGFRPIDTYA